MANVKITELTAYTNPASTDVVPIVDLVNDQTKKVTLANIFQNFPDGTEATPSIAFDGDNTGIYRPGADQIALATNGTNRLHIASDGKVGVGTTSVANNIKLEIQDSGSTGINIRNTNNSANDTRRIAFSQGSGNLTSLNTVADIFSRTEGVSPLTGAITFRTNQGNNLVEAMRIDSSGRLGVGTSTPSSLMEIAGNNSGNDEDYINVNNAFRFKETDPTLTNGQPTGSILWETSDSSDPGVHAYIACRGSNSGAGQLAFGTGFASSLDTRLFISSTGKVGIGTQSPGALLDVAAAVPEIRLTDVGGGAFHSLSGTGNGTLKISADNDNGGANASSLQFFVDGTERSRIDSSGRLLVGTSSVTSFGTSDPAFQVSGDDFSTSTISVKRSDAGGGGANLFFGVSNGTPASPTIVADDDQLAKIRFYGYDGSDWDSYGAEISAEVDGTPGANDMPGRLVFSTTADGSASPTERMRITSDAYVRLASGTGGIQFNGDTAAANALDDYEEGTFTPAYEPETNSFTSVTYQDQAGSYTKIGNRVFFQGRIRTSAITVGTASGNVSISGLPFTSVNDSANGRNAGSISFASGFGGDTPSALYVEINATEFFLYYRATSNGPTASLDVSDLATGATSNALFFSGCYTVA